MPQLLPFRLCGSLKKDRLNYFVNQGGAKVNDKVYRMWYNLNKKAVISVQHELLKKQKLDGSAHRVDSMEPWPVDWTWPGAV